MIKSDFAIDMVPLFTSHKPLSQLLACPNNTVPKYNFLYHIQFVDVRMTTLSIMIMSALSRFGENDVSKV